MSRIMLANFKPLALIPLLALALLVQSCGELNPFSKAEKSACELNPLLCQSDSESFVRFKNTSTSRNVVRIYYSNDCTVTDWGGGNPVNIGPTASITVTFTSEQKFDVKADWEDDSCTTLRGVEAPIEGETKKVTLDRSASCNVEATKC